MYAHELFEQNKPRVVVTYPGRFQPWHSGHSGVFSQLQKKFGSENVYIATSNDQSSAKSPFNFSDKYQLMTAAGVPADKIIQTNAMYALPEGIDPTNTIFVTAVGAPDADRLNPDSVLKRDKKDKEGNVIKPAGSPGYYKKWNPSQDPLTADQHGYVIIIPEIKKAVSINGQTYDVSHGTETRNLWNTIRNDDKARSEFLSQMYGRPSQELANIFDKIPQTASEDVVADNGDSTSPIHGGQIYETEGNLEEKINLKTTTRGFHQEKDMGWYKLIALGDFVSRMANDPPTLRIVAQLKADPATGRDGAEIGELDLKVAQGEYLQNNPGAEALVAGGVYVDDAYQRKGVGSAMYQFAKELGNDVIASISQSDDAKAMWSSMNKKGVTEGSLNEFAPGAGDDGGGEDPYKYPKPEHYARSADYFGKFEADHFDREDFDDATGVFKGYWGRTQIAYFKFDNPARPGGDDPGMGWYYEPESASNSDVTSAKPAVGRSDERKQQELGMINAFLKSGQTPKPGSQIFQLMKRHGLAEGAPIVVAQAPIHIRNSQKNSQQQKSPTAYQQGIAAQGKPYDNPYPFDSTAGSEANYDHNQYRAGYKKPGVAENASGVIATKKQARDPRYSMSLTKDVRPGQIEKNLRAFKLAEQQNSNTDMFELFAKFLPLAMKDLGLTSLPKIVPELHIESHDGQATFGRFVNDELAIHLALANRHPVDILRTLAHELVHFKQLTLGKIKDTSGITGSPEENQANTIAGIIMRHFNKQYPDAVNMQPIDLDESLVTVNYGIGKNPGKLVKVGPGGRVPHAKLHVNVDKKTAKKLGIPHLNENGDDEAGEIKKQKNLIPFPKGTVKVDVSDVYDWYKLGMEISDLDDADPADFGKGPPQTVMAFGDEEQEHKYLPQLQRLGLKTHDIDEAAQKCPPATQSIELNLRNRQKAIDDTGYGPMNPDMPNRKFWMRKAQMWQLDSVDEAKQSLCDNCAAFDVTKKTLDCIAQGIGTDSGSEDPQQVIDAGELGYCRFLKFKCASRRTCDAWVVGGPIEDDPVDENFADGRNPGDKGSLKAKVKGKVTMAKARAILSNEKSTPRAKQLAHWFINMNKGRAK